MMMSLPRMHIVITFWVLSVQYGLEGTGASVGIVVRKSQLETWLGNAPVAKGASVAKSTDSLQAFATPDELEQDLCANQAKDYETCTPDLEMREIQCVNYNIVRLVTWICTRRGMFAIGRNVYSCPIFITLFPKYSVLHQARCNSTSNTLPGLRSEIRSAIRRIQSLCPAADPRQDLVDRLIPSKFSSFPSCFSVTALVTGWIWSRIALAINQAILVLSGRPFNTKSWSSSHVGWTIPCWERELLAAQRVYDNVSISWSIDDDCVDVLQVIIREYLVHFLDYFSRNRLFEAVARFISLRYDFNGGLANVFQSVLEIMQRLYGDGQYGQDFIWQRWLYPMFNRFRSTASDRRGRGHEGRNSTVVTCNGLKGRASQVRDTVLRLTRLVLINELEFYKYSPTAVVLICMSQVIVFTYLHQCPL
eukprot:scpid57992/ scgid24486/ 